MKRRHFIAGAIAAVASGGSASSNLRAAPEPSAGRRPSASETLPRTVAGMSLEELEDDCRDRLFNQYLPFWDRGGFDQPRMLMMNILNLKRMIDNAGKLTPFPE